MPARKATPTATMTHQQTPADPGAPSQPGPDWADAHDIRAVQAAIAAHTRDAGGEGDAPAWVQTHISTVFLAQRLVFKFKRPVNLGFADFATLEQRRHFCEEEVRLNRRLAPDVYLDVLPLYRQGGAFMLGRGPEDAGHPVDWCVVMRRLEDARQLGQRLAAGSVTAEDMRRLAGHLVRFHAAQPTMGEDDPAAPLENLTRNWEENFAQTERAVGSLLDAETYTALREAVRGVLRGQRALLEQRAREGRIREGHGDLRCEHIYLNGGVRVIDCIEFNTRFRFGDVANDLAFLLMDVARLGHPQLSRALLDEYARLSGDVALERLVPFYACYRAYVRGKVANFRLADSHLDPATRQAVQAEARAYFRLAAGYLPQLRPPMLVLVAGLMGTGKSRLAANMAQKFGVAHYNSDVLRKQMAGNGGGDGGQGGAHRGNPAAWGADLYGEAWNTRTYEALLAAGEAELARGRSVVLDASFSKAHWRGRAVAMAQRLGARWIMLETRLDEAETLARLRARRLKGGSVSDGREELLAPQRAAFEPMHDIPPDHHRVVDTSGSKEHSLAVATAGLDVPPPVFGLGDRGGE